MAMLVYQRVFFKKRYFSFEQDSQLTPVNWPLQASELSLEKNLKFHCI